MLKKFRHVKPCKMACASTEVFADEVVCWLGHTQVSSGPGHHNISSHCGPGRLSLRSDRGYTRCRLKDSRRRHVSNLKVCLLFNSTQYDPHSTPALSTTGTNFALSWDQVFLLSSSYSILIEILQFQPQRVFPFWCKLTSRLLSKYYIILVNYSLIQSTYMSS